MTKNSKSQITNHKQISNLKILMVILVALLVFPLPAKAQSLVDLNQRLKDLQNQRTALSQSILTNKQKAKEKKAEADRLSNEIKKLEASIKQTEQKINDLQGNINQTQTDIDQKTKEIITKENELRQETDNQNNTLKMIYETTITSTTVMLLSSQSLSEAIDRNSYLTALEARIEKNIGEITRLKEELEKQKVELQKQKENLAAMKTQQEQYKFGLSKQKENKGDLLRNVKIAQADYERLVEDAKKAYLDVNSELYKLTEAARAKYQRDGNKKVGNINFSWPAVGAITAKFGVPTPIQSFHTGLDIDCAIGDALTAAADGKVSYAAGNSRYGYGLYVMIEHGSGIATLYGHMSGFAVSEDDEVKKGDLIGYCGNTGFAVAFSGGDGSHLHFEVREDGIPVNPEIYLP